MILNTPRCTHSDMCPMFQGAFLRCERFPATEQNQFNIRRVKFSRFNRKLLWFIRFKCKNTRFSNKNLVIKEKISGSERTELSTLVVRVTHFTDLENFLNIFHWPERGQIYFYLFLCQDNAAWMLVVGKKCNPNPNRKLMEMSRTGNLLLLISSLILRCFAKTFSFIVIHVLWTHSTRFYFKFIVGNKGGLKQVFFSYTHYFH
jgi:hypothetical protein